MHISVFLIFALFLAAAFLLLRLFPIWRLRTRGCDAYNILLCAEDVRRARRIPPKLPGLFLLEEPEQWYPPVFFLLAAFLPQRWLRERFWLLNQYIDLVNALVLFTIVALQAGLVLAGIAVLAYAMVAGLVQEFAALNTRPLGLLVVNALLLSGHLASEDVRWAPLAILCGVVLIYTHKLSAQQIWFTLPILALATGKICWLALLPTIYLAAFAVWPRGFWNIIKGHGAIIRFWHRNWPLLGAHAVRQSPIYGDGHTHQDFYAAWPCRSALTYAKQALHQNYFAVPGLLGVVAGASDSLSFFLGAWIVSVYIAATAVHFVPRLRAIGLGRQYVKFALLPSLLATALALAQNPRMWLVVISAAAVALTLRQYLLVARLLHAGQDDGTSMRTPELDKLLQRLANDEDARVMALPVQLCDLVAYATRRPVYWGTHAQVFDSRLEAFFPVLKRPLADYAREAGLNRLLLDTRYASVQELGMTMEDAIQLSGFFVLLRLDRPWAGVL